MTDKNKYFYLEILFTLLLIFSAISLYGKILSAYKLFSVLGLICGICFSYFLKNRHNQVLRSFITIGSFAVIAWILYSILNSTFIYKDVIIICIKGLILLELTLSLNACTPSFLTYMQVLSIPLFMSHLIFIKGEYSGTLVIFTFGYLISWFVILKLKFYELFRPVKKK
jgi:hypothetical protein